MTSESATRRTPLHAAHLAAGGRMVAFAGWEMPVQYTGVVDEHNAVRERAGLFDVSHMGELSVRGPRSLDLLQRITCNDVARLKPGRAHYNGLITPGGCFVDDLLIYKRDENDYLVVLNAANVDKDIAWVRENVGDLDVELEDQSDVWALIALQGPRSVDILGRLTDEPIADLRYYRFLEGTVAGAPCLISRTGYTGEDGFEIYTPADGAEAIWNAALECGRPHGLVPAGLGARDTLRLEARMALYGNDIDETTTVLEADLGWIVKWKKGDFVGREALLRQREEGVPRKLVGFEMTGRAIARHGYAALHDGVEVGRVTSGSFAPFLKKRIGMAYLPPKLGEPGTEFAVRIRDRAEPAVVVPTPFYKREQ